MKMLINCINYGSAVTKTAKQSAFKTRLNIRECFPKTNLLVWLAC